MTVDSSEHYNVISYIPHEEIISNYILFTLISLPIYVISLSSHSTLDRNITRISLIQNCVFNILFTMYYVM